MDIDLDNSWSKKSQWAVILGELNRTSSNRKKRKGNKSEETHNSPRGNAGVHSLVETFLHQSSIKYLTYMYLTYFNLITNKTTLCADECNIYRIKEFG